MALNHAQESAVIARGNVLVIAGAGTGKTRTLVERCVRILLEEIPPVSMDEILMVTFTEAAAAEMRQRIRSRLEEESTREQHGRWSEQLALFDTACIGTLHSFCLRLIREHFYELSLDPQLSVLSEEDAGILAAETLEHLLEDYYGDRHALSQAFQLLVQEYGQSSDRPVRHLILKLHRYAQSLPDGAGWVRTQTELFRNPNAELWKQWLPVAFQEWRERWTDSLARAARENAIAQASLAALENLPPGFSRQAFEATLESIVAAFENCPHGKKKAWKKPFAAFQAEAEFLRTLTPRPGRADPLEEDWGWVRGHMETLLCAAGEFTQRFTDIKRELGLADFQDLEQHVLRLLWNFEAGEPTPVALQWRERLRFIFVDEYQDINAAQDKIIEAISRPAPDANRFLVGDVKQSIYRFRLANPSIFQVYARTWRGEQGTAVPLKENFRSREGILTFANSLFSLLMRPEAGGVTYDAEAHLEAGTPCKFGNAPAGAEPVPVELHLRLKTDAGHEEHANDNEELSDQRELEEADKEARVVAARLKDLHASRYPVWDDAADAFRPVEWRDMAILLRAPSGKAESYAKVFGSLGLPLLVARGGFYNSSEIRDLLSVLEILDNPLQDIPALAVLRSPLLGLNARELSAIRLAARGTRFWTAFVRWHRAPNDPVLFAKVDPFLRRYREWRKLARQASLSRCLETILAETHYGSWLLTQPRGQMRHANVKRLLALARRFDQFQKQGLFRFLRYLEGQRDSEAEPAAAAPAQANAVQLMSVHQSKGLEFPVVVVADVGKPFNLADMRDSIILDEQFGLCPSIRPPHSGATYPSLAHWRAHNRQTRELLGEEQRLLYVAVTRARDLLLLAGSVVESKFDEAAGLPAELPNVLRARCWADWILQWFSRNCGNLAPGASHGRMALLRWHAYRGDTELPGEEAVQADPPERPGVVDEAAWRAVQHKLAVPYPHLVATRHSAKTSVTGLRRRAQEQPPEGGRPAGEPAQPAAHLRRARSGTLSAAEIGNAHHAFLKLASLDSVRSVAQLEREAERLRNSAAMTPVELEALDFEALARFWNSALGRTILQHKDRVRREVAFTVRIGAGELAQLAGAALPDRAPPDEWVILQGVADLAVFAPDGLTLVDFKTDHVDASGTKGLLPIYGPQVRLYAVALSRIYALPVRDCWLYFLRPGQAVEVPFAFQSELWSGRTSVAT